MPNEAKRHIPAALPDLSIKVRQDVTEYRAAATLFPERNVAKMNDQYYIYNIADNFRTAHDIRANATESNGIDSLGLSTAAYSLAEHALHEYVSDRDRANADPAVDPYVDAVEDVTTILMRNKEVEAALKTLTTTTYGSGNLLTLSSNAWAFNTSTSSPIEDIDTASLNIQAATAKVPNTIVLGLRDHNVLKDHSEILDRIKYSERGIITEDILSAVFGVQNYTVSKGLYRSTVPGISGTVTRIFDNAAVVCYNETNPRLRTSNFGVTFQKREPQIDIIRDDHRDADKIQQKWFYEQKIGLSSSGFLIKATVTG